MRHRDSKGRLNAVHVLMENRESSQKRRRTEPRSARRTPFFGYLKKPRSER